MFKLGREINGLCLLSPVLLQGSVILVIKIRARPQRLSFPSRSGLWQPAFGAISLKPPSFERPFSEQFQFVSTRDFKRSPDIGKPFLGWVDGSVGKMLALQTRGPKFDLPELVLKKKKKRQV